MTRLPPADRASRLAAWILDWVLNICCAIPAFVVEVTGAPRREFALFAGFSVACYLALWTYQAWLRATRGQTIGKRILGIRIVMVDDGSNPGFWRAVFVRDLVPFVIDRLVAGLFGIADALFIFGRERRCIHDHMAGTIVVRPDIEADEVDHVFD